MNRIMRIISVVKPHLIVLLLFALISISYFSPVIEGKRLDAHDKKTHQGMSKEVVDFRNKTGKEALWTNSMFSGMPAYQISAKYKSNLIQYVDNIFKIGLPRPANLLFLYLLGFYFLLLSLGVDYRLSIIGAIAFAFSSYFFIIIQAGHFTKAHAISYLPMVVASVIFTYRKNMFLGGALTALTVALQLYCNHLQITYYLLLILIIFGVIQLVQAIKNDNIIDFAKRSLILLFSALLAAGTSYTRLATTLEYSKDSTRGKSELTDNLDNKTSGLDKDYATQWSYGKAETFTLLIPNFHGGASIGSLSEDSETYNAIKRSPNAKKIIEQVPLYWGDQPIVSGPTYAGSIVILLFFLGLIIVRSELRIWLLLATILSIMLAWGKNFMFLTEWFLDYFPGYNKFRAVSMILIVAEFTLPLLGFLGLNKFMNSNVNTILKENALKYSFYITAGLCLFFALMPSLFFDFTAIQDINLKKSGWPVEALQADRAILLSSDAWRSLIFVSLAFLVLWMFLKNKLQSKYTMLIIGTLIIVDMWTINKRYLNETHFIRKSKAVNPYVPTNADRLILQDKDLNFRVYNQSVSTFNDASTSYFHKSIGGYHGAKLKRYQELIEQHISNGNMKVLNMLNTRYFITQNGQVQRNPDALGNAWFVDNINIVQDADSEILALNNFDPSNTAIVDKRFLSQLYNTKSDNTDLVINNLNYKDNANSKISLLEYQPNYLKYSINAEEDGVVIFSEIFYDKGWNAYVDDALHSYFRANYVLRGMSISKGEHTIEFRFEPKTYTTGENISLASSIILLLFLAFTSFKVIRA